MARRLLRILALALVIGVAAPTARTDEPTRLVNTLDNSAVEIEALFASLTTVQNPEVVELLPVVITRQDKWPVHAVGDHPVRLTQTNAQALSRTLLTVDSYLQAMSACLFVPEVAFRFRANHEVVLAFVSFECGEVVFEDSAGRQLSGRLKLGTGRAPLLAVARAAWPDNQELQALAR